MSKFTSFWHRLIFEESGEVEIVAADPALAVDPAPAADPAPADPAVTTDDGPAPSLDELMASLGTDEPAPADPNAPADTEPAIPAEWTQLSPFVTSQEQIPSAIQAATEVWSVMNGQASIKTLFDAAKQGNPAAFEKIASEAREYLGVQQSGPNPLETLKTEKPEVYKAVNDFVTQQTGKGLEGPADPREARLQAIEQRYAQEEQQRQQEAYQRQIVAADDAAHSFLTEKLKGTFAEGQNDHFIGLIAQKLGKNLQQSMQEILAGNTKSLEKALREVQKDETARLRKYNENLVKQYRTQKNMVPATKGAPVAAKNGPPVKKPGESDTDFAKRVWDSGYTA